jgi:tetratricopeptide (TPR) repeat protein/uncharacterized small protein (DUF1192 family)
MSNAAKFRKKAAEFEQLKQIDRAIAAYAKAIEESESAGEDIDVALFNKVGDLALRQGRVPDAITYYERAVEHYATSGLFNNAIALCNKILRNAPGRANVYFTLGRISARKGLRGDATRNFLEYATRMQQEGRIEEGIRALAEVADLMPELSDVRALVDDLAARAGLALPRRRTPLRSDRIPTPLSNAAVREARSQDLVFLDIDYGDSSRRTPAAGVPFTPAPQAPREPLPELASEAVADQSSPLAPSASVPLLTDDHGHDLPFLDVASAVAPIEGLEATGEFEESDTPLLEGFAPDELPVPTDLPLAQPIADVTFLTPSSGTEQTEPLEDVVLEDFEHATDDPGVARAIYTETPPFGGGIDFHDDITINDTPLVIDALDVTSVPELDDAIAAGQELVERAEFAQRARPPIDSVIDEVIDAVEEQLPAHRPPYRFDPHDFILPGELPPLLLDDAVVDAGLEALVPAPAAFAVPDHERPDDRESTPDLVADVLETMSRTPLDSSNVPDSVWPDLVEAEAVASEQDSWAADDDESSDAEPATAGEPPPVAGRRQVSMTPSLPIGAVAVEAGLVATARRDSLRSAVARLPQNWLLRRRLAEALFEAGERDAALAELETAQQGLLNDGEYAAAADIAEELVRVSPDLVPYHQKRVELAVRTQDEQQLRRAYLDLADALVRLGEEGRARAVYARVLEIDPFDDRARAALGAAAPPPPAAPRPDEGFVNLAEWLRDEGDPVDTRMRMREPVISGDEQADFDALLRHFKEGVARSLGEDDFESQYDLGVAYKEMGLLDDAISEFQKALRSRTHRLPAYEALGQCFVEQGRHQIAATVLTRALHEPGLDDD